MNIEKADGSYDGIVYDVVKSNGGCKASASIGMTTSAKDVYIHSSEESYFVTYTSGGAVSGETASPLEKEESCILPKRYEGYKSPKLYYQGNLITEYELIETAVKTGAITLDESETAHWNYANAYRALISSKATPLYDWSTTLYSEDRMYVFRVKNGIIVGASSTWFDDGTTFQDVANAIASGEKMLDEDGKSFALQMCDPELFHAAHNIGTAKQEYDTLIHMYRNGQLTEKQFQHDCYPLLLLLFGNEADIYSKKQFSQLSDFFEQDTEVFLKNAFANYNPSNQALVDELLIEKRYHAYSGLY